MPRLLLLALAFVLASGAATAQTATPLGTFAQGLNSTTHITQLADGRVLVSNVVDPELPTQQFVVSAFTSSGAPLGTFATFASPVRGIEQLSDERVLVLLRNDPQPRVYAANGTFLGNFASVSSITAPWDVLQLSDGRVLISDLGGTIFAYQADGVQLADFAQGLERPSYLAQAADSTVLVSVNPTLSERPEGAACCVQFGHFVRAFSPAGVFQTTIASGMDVRPGIGTLSDGTVLVSYAEDLNTKSGSATNEVRQFTTAGQFVDTFASTFIPGDIVETANGDVLVAQSVGQQIDAFRPASASPLTLEITGTDVTPARGQSVTLNATLSNTSSSAISARAAIDVEGPNGFEFEQGIGSGTIPAGFSGPLESYTQLRYRIPPNAEGGTYTVTVIVQEDAPGFPELARDTFSFVLPEVQSKTGTLASGALALTPEAPGASPNPFRGATTIHYTLDDDADVRLAVFDATGREVAVLAEGTRASGAHAATFEAGALPAGVYVWRLVAGGRVQTGRVTLAR